MFIKLIDKNLFTKIIWTLYCTFIFFYLLNGFFQSLDTDFGWHLKVGEEIAHFKEVPHIEHFDFILEGQRWVDHEWLANVFIYFMYSNFGYVSLNVFFALIIVASLIILNQFTQKYFLNVEKLHSNVFNFLIIAFQILGVIAMQGHFGVRVQEITVFNLLILIIIIHRFSKMSDAQFQVSDIFKYRILWFLPFLFYFWACVHAGFLIGLFVIFLWICFKFLSILIQEKDYLFKDCDKIADKVQKPEVYSIVLLKNLKNNLEFQKLIIFSIFAFLSFLATLITPYGLELYSFLSGYSNTYYLTHISEWLPFYYSPILYWQLLYSAFVVLAIGLMFKYKKISDIQKWYIFLSIIFFFLAFKSRRHFPLFFIVSFPLLIQFFYKFFKLPPKVGQYITSSLIIKFYIVLCFLLLIVYQIVTINPVRDPFVKFEKGYPIKAIEFIKNHPEYLNKRTLSKYRWGGYLTWVLPENKLFIDGRLPQYEFGGHTMLQEYYEFYQEGQARRKLNEHKIELVLISSQIKQSEPDWFEKHFLNVFQNDIEKPKYYLKDYLDNSGAWEMVYEDEISVIYIKNN